MPPNRAASKLKMTIALFCGNEDKTLCSDDETQVLSLHSL